MRSAIVRVIGVIMSLAAGTPQLASPVPRSSVDQTLVTATEASPHFWSGVSPDGKYLAYSDGRSGNLAVREVETGTARLLTHSQPPAWGGVEFAAWSPDAQRLIYAMRQGGTIRLMVISVDGGEPRAAYSGEGLRNLRPYAWTPDGSAVVVSMTRSTGIDLVLVSLADGAVRVIRQGAVERVVMSPDGASILFDVPAPDRRGRDVFMLNVKTGAERAVAAHKADDFAMGWDPQNTFVLVGSDRRGQTIDLWAVPLKDGVPSGQPSLVGEAVGRSTGLGFARTGQFYYAAESGGLDIHLADTTLGPKPAGQPRPLGGMRPGYQRGQGAWSRDGQRLAFTEQAPGGARDLVVRWVAGRKDDHVIPILLTNIERPIWLPDGNSVAVEANDAQGRRGSFKIDLASGATELLALGAIAPGFSRDGKFIIFLRPGQPRTFVKKDLATGAEQILEKGEGGIVVSADGEWMVRFINDGELVTFYVQPVSGGARREFHSTTRSKLTNEFAWSPDKTHFYFVSVGPEELWRVPLAGGQAERLGIVLQSIKHLSVSPEGRIAISGGAVQTEVRRLRPSLR